MRIAALPYTELLKQECSCLSSGSELVAFGSDDRKQRAA